MISGILCNLSIINNYAIIRFSYYGHKQNYDDYDDNSREDYIFYEVANE